MSELIKLKNAPVKEALIDIQGIFTDATSASEILGSFEKSYPQLKNTHPKSEKRFQRQISVDAKSPAQITDNQVGWLFRSADELEAIQYRLNGFSFSLLKSYSDWDSLCQKSKASFQSFLNIRPDFIITRIATRYINEIRVPYPFDISKDEYLKNSQSIPTSSENCTVETFTEQLRWIDNKNSIQVNLVKFLQEAPANSIETNFIVDIDIFRNLNQIDPQNDLQSVWDQISAFKTVKNEIFFSVVGSKTVERYK